MIQNTWKTKMFFPYLQLIDYASEGIKPQKNAKEGLE